MVNIRKSTGILLIAAMLLFAFSGCESKPDTIAWKIGGIGPITGDNTDYGIAVRNGMELAVAEINANGGINGYPVILRFEDDAMSVEKALLAYENLKSWNMDILVGCVTSSCSIAVAESSASDHLFQLTPTASAVEFSNNQNVFQVCLTDSGQGASAARYIGEKPLAATVGILYNAEDPYSLDIYQKFIKEAENQPFQIVAAESFENAADCTKQLEHFKQSRAEILFLPVYYQDATEILLQAAAMDFSPVFFGCDGLEGILTNTSDFDLSLAEGIMMLTHFSPVSTEERDLKFISAYEKKYDTIPNSFSADAYDAIYILKAAIEAGNIAPTENTCDICDKLQIAMTEITYDGLTGSSMTWNSTGEVSKLPRVIKIEDGAWKALP